MSDATLIIELQVKGQTLRLTPDEAMNLWAELGWIFDRVPPVDEEELKVGPGTLVDPPPQIVPIYVPRYPVQPWQPTWGGGWSVTNTGGTSAAKLKIGNMTFSALDNA